MVRIIHTSDWHLGAQLYEQSRHAEHVNFIAWLKELMQQEKPDALIVAGDIFDTYSPPNASLELYYSLLGDIYKESLCKVVVVIGGNHDSPALLNSPDKVLSHLKVKVVGSADIDNVIIKVAGVDGRRGLVIGAIPFLRDADLRLSGAGDDYIDCREKLRDGLKKYYEKVASQARQEAGEEVPLVLTGHLFLTGTSLSDDMSEKTRMVGKLGQISSDLLPKADYYALGHLHVPQAVNKCETCRYSGAPLPMSFSEVGRQKSVVVVDFDEKVTVRTVEIPCFQQMELIKGTPDVVEQRIQHLVDDRADTWLEIQIDAYDGDLTEFWNGIPLLVADSTVKILAKQDVRKHQPWRMRGGRNDSLDTLKPEDVFTMRLKDAALSESERDVYVQMFREAMGIVNQQSIGSEVDA